VVCRVNVLAAFTLENEDFVNTRQCVPLDSEAVWERYGLEKFFTSFGNRTPMFRSFNLHYSHCIIVEVEMNDISPLLHTHALSSSA
jgi:hypothetical protein